MKRALIVTVFLLMTAGVVSAVTVRETCLNDTHKVETFEYVMTEDGVTTTYNYTQTHLCLYNCSNSSGRCAGTDREADSTMMWLTYASGVVLLILGTALGIPYGKLMQREEIKGFDTMMVVRYMFFFVGFYLVYLSLGMSSGLARLYGGGTDIIGAMDTSAMIITFTLVLFLFMFVIEFVGYVIKMLQRRAAVAKERRYGLGERQ